MLRNRSVTIELNNQRIPIPILNVTNSIKIPVIASNTIFLPSYSKRKIPVRIPISSISLPFIPASSIKSHILVDHRDKILSFQNYQSDLLLL